MNSVVQKDLEEFFRLIDYTEESSEGKIRRPVTIYCSRAGMTKEVEQSLMNLRRHIE